jgi:hypothetical protein
VAVDRDEGESVASLPKCSGLIGKGKAKHVCGEVVRYACGSLCDDCYARKAARYHGNDQLIKTLQVGVN